MVKRGELGREDSELDRIQELFPSDDLRLYERDPLSPKKSLLRTKSGPAVKLQKVLTKSKISPDLSSPNSKDGASSVTKSEPDRRVFIMEGPVQFTMGVQRHDRYLFLFSDVLLIAKPRSVNTYKLKDKIRLCELWLSSCLDDVCEAVKSAETSFVMGWPTTNVAATFSSSQTKELWQDKLHRLILDAKEKEGSLLTSIQVTFWDHILNKEFCETIKVNNRHTVIDCIKFLLAQLDKKEVKCGEYQLWVKIGKEDAPYPLIGHEYPFCIKMNFVRELLRKSDVDIQNLKNINTDSKCTFILRNTSRKSVCLIGARLGKKAKKLRKPTLIHWPFRRQSSKSDIMDSPLSTVPGNLFGQPLGVLCKNGSLPKPILAILNQLFLNGPFSVGIFRKSANARACRELRSKLDKDPDLDLNSEPVLVLSCVFKDFLRSLPDCLLQSNLYSDWLDAAALESDWQRMESVLSLLNRLPPCNLLLLRYFLCVLWHISHRSSENKMTTLNLAVCIGPTLLIPNNISGHQFQPEVVSRHVPKLLAYLIDHCPDIFGEECLQLLGDIPEKDPSRQDSGAEESDSVHSAHGGGYRRDDSSIDSLERELLDENEPSPKLPNKNKMSLTNLSRDSGLTLSDTQLYTPDEELDSEGSSSGENHHFTKSVPHLEMTGLDSGPSTLYGRAGISIDGSCNDVMRKRRQGLDCPRSRSGISSSGARQNSYYDNLSTIHTPIQYSRSYSYGTAYSVMGRKLDNLGEISPNSSRIRSQSNEVKQNCKPDFPTLVRSASEESLLSKYTPTEAFKRPACHQKGRAPSPPNWKSTEREQSGDIKNLMPIFRSTAYPDRHALWFATQTCRTDWKRSQSTSRIDDIDCSHDSSTLSLVSSEDSTPQVSRSNSKVQDSPAASHADAYCVYKCSNRIGSICSSSSEASQKSHGSLNSIRSQSSHDSGRSQGSSISRPRLPPSYQETMNRRKYQNIQSPPTDLTKVTEQMIKEQTMLSAKARQLYEESVRIYNEQAETPGQTHHAVLVKVDSADRSPKHGTLTRTVSEGPRLKHLPPVHVTDAQIAQSRMQTQKTVSCSHLQKSQYSQVSASDNSEDWKKEISWSVAQLRNIFTQKAWPRNESTKTFAEASSSPLNISNCDGVTNSLSHHKRTDSFDSTNSGEESFV